MRHCLIIIALLASGSVLASDPPIEVPPPPTLQPGADDAALQPEIAIVEKDDATVTEYRMGGKLYMVKVKPKAGPEYYLQDDTGSGQMVRREGPASVHPPMWVIKRF